MAKRWLLTAGMDLSALLNEMSGSGVKALTLLLRDTDSSTSYQCRNNSKRIPQP